MIARSGATDASASRPGSKIVLAIELMRAELMCWCVGVLIVTRRWRQRLCNCERINKAHRACITMPQLQRQPRLGESRLGSQFINGSYSVNGIDVVFMRNGVGACK